MQCPYCKESLVYIDYFGQYLGRDKWNRRGKIYKCINETKCDSESFNYFFYTYDNDSSKLYHGYPY